MIFAAIDIGSNAIRLQITRIIWHDGQKPVYKILESIRFPLRLGKDAFRTGEITFRSEIKFINLMMAFRTLIDLYEADDIYACATSAIRDSVNGERIVQRAYQKSGIHIQIISGEREAEILDLVVHKDIDEGHYMHVDVGGGSTEINMIDGTESYAWKSFMLGSVRNMQGRDKPEAWEALADWIGEKMRRPFDATICTGGNITTLLKLSYRHKDALKTVGQLQAIVDEVNALSISERIEKLGLREDRADVLPYASAIYLRAMALSKSENVLIPNVGLKDGITEMLFRRNC